MGYQICRVRSLEIVSAYTLRVHFDDHTEQTMDFRAILAGELYGLLLEHDWLVHEQASGNLLDAGSRSRPEGA
jgi:hypothetical protein